MNLDTYIREVIEQEVRAVVREELAKVLDEIKKLEQKRVVNQPVVKNEPKPPQKHIIRPSELSKMLSVTKPTLWRMEKEGRLPKRIKFSHNCVGWFNTDIEEWLEQNRRQNGE
ncbi:helix-turn-helix transcriptional regulator [Natronogracilivirga saccharolytica]|nr:AlpA family phage regulatory protein [Natronogracilivirga saccharolytica]